MRNKRNDTRCEAPQLTTVGHAACVVENVAVTPMGAPSSVETMMLHKNSKQQIQNKWLTNFQTAHATFPWKEVCGCSQIDTSMLTTNLDVPWA